MIISITNLKGGCGKTTISTNLAVSFAHIGKSVCLIDTDLGQGSALEWSGNREESLPYIPVIGKSIKQLTKDVVELDKQYDIVLIDGVPQLEELADRTIMVSHVVLIPVKNSIIDFRSMESFLKRYRQVSALKEANGLKTKAYIIINEASTNTNAYKDIEEAVKELDEPLLFTIPIRTAYRDAFLYGLGVIEYDDPKARVEMTEFVKKVNMITKDF